MVLMGQLELQVRKARKAYKVLQVLKAQAAQQVLMELPAHKVCKV
jgi:hypothetical protein